MSLFSCPDDGYTESENIRLKAEVEELKVATEDLTANIEKRDLSNGRLVASCAEKEEAIANLHDQITDLIKVKDNKSMTSLDLQAKVTRLVEERQGLLVKVGVLASEAEETWEQGLKKYIQSVARQEVEALRDAWNDNSWLEG